MHWTGQGSGWIVDKIEDIYIKICNYDPLSGSTYIPLPLELNSPMKGLINPKNKDKTINVLCGVILDLSILQ